MSPILLDCIQKLLWTEWDPIGINGYGGSSDEYDSYAIRVASMLAQGRDEYAIAEYLKRSALTDIGVEQSSNHQEIAKRASEIYREAQ